MKRIRAGAFVAAIRVAAFFFACAERLARGHFEAYAFFEFDTVEPTFVRFLFDPNEPEEYYPPEVAAYLAKDVVPDDPDDTSLVTVGEVS